MKVNEGSGNKLYSAIIKWYKRDPSTNEMSLSFSSLWNPELDTVFQKEIVPLGHKYIQDMLKLVIDEELWSYPLMEAIDEILGISVISSRESVLDSYEYWHDVWRNDFIQMLKNLKRGAKNGENLEEYGLLGTVYSDTPDISKKIGNVDSEVLRNIIDIYGKD